MNAQLRVWRLALLGSMDLAACAEDSDSSALANQAITPLPSDSAANSTGATSTEPPGASTAAREASSTAPIVAASSSASAPTALEVARMMYAPHERIRYAAGSPEAMDACVKLQQRYVECFDNLQIETECDGPYDPRSQCMVACILDQPCNMVDWCQLVCEEVRSLPGTCGASEPWVEGVMTGFAACESGERHRPTSGTCGMDAPGVAEVPAFDAGSATLAPGQCNIDADCVEREYGSCSYAGPLVPRGSPGDCYYGCATDAHCEAGQACLCGGTPAQSHCIPADCKVDADCGEGELCSVVDDDSIGDACDVFPRVRMMCLGAEGECRTDADCQRLISNWSRLHCEGSSGTARCSSVLSCPIGRPFLIDGEARRSALCIGIDATPGEARETASVHNERIAAHWAEQALMEHASIAAFARFTLQLLQLGAPAGLVQASVSAGQDEAEHARLCFEIATRHRGAALSAGPLNIAGALPTLSLEQIVDLVIEEGCIGETCAALFAAEGCSHATDVHIKAVLAKIRDDEFRHAELAWRFVAWATEQPEFDTRALPSMFTRAIEQRGTQTRLHDSGARHGAVHPNDDDALLGAGILGTAREAELTRAALGEVIRPCAEALLHRVASSATTEPVVPYPVRALHSG